MPESVVLLHGFGASLDTWEAWAQALSARYRVVRFDLPGSGLTGPDPTGDYTDAREMKILIDLMDQLSLARASLVAVNRRIKKPAPAKATFDQPLYLVLARDGSYLCGCCALDEGELVVHLYPGVPLGARRFRNGIDAEVIGQVTAILRRLA